MENTQHEFGEIRSPGSHLAAAAVLILISGAFMVWAGYAFAEGRIAYGLWITRPPGFTIEAAFLLVRQHDRATGHSAPSLGTRMGQEGIILLAGGVMVLAGFAAAASSWLLGAPLILLGLPVIAIVVWLGRQSGRTPRPVHRPVQPATDLRRAQSGPAPKGRLRPRRRGAPVG